jgi:hypothetical protein
MTNATAEAILAFDFFYSDHIHTHTNTQTLKQTHTHTDSYVILNNQTGFLHVIINCIVKEITQNTYTHKENLNSDLN